MRTLLSIPLLALLFLANFISDVGAIAIDVNSTDSVVHAAWVFAHGMMTYYNGNQTGGAQGKFVNPYYWWESGAAWGSLIDYWYYTGDETWNEQVQSSLLSQVGPNNDYMPPSEATSEGNDDQSFWGFAVMTAAERNFTNPDSSQPQWLALAEAVFDTMAARWDTSTCNGGLRWQIFPFNGGYDYKNTISNAGLFMMAARLARFTGNSTYVDWAEKTWNWTESVGFLDQNYYFYDGAHVETDCTNITEYQWTYNPGIFLAGSAYLYNYTGSALWGQRVQSILDSMTIFFDSTTGIMYEQACEIAGTCDVDQKAFKGILANCMGLTAQLAPFTYNTIYQHLAQTVPGIEQSCVGGTDSVTCGTTWLDVGWDNTWGLGQELSAMEVVLNLLVQNVPAPYTSSTGGSSSGIAAPVATNGTAITTADRAGAGIITSVALLMMLGSSWWVVL
ncbi:glycoside hydrolase [Lipomyces kononenkoae]|uniref:Glycoside hydrolase n=1 Tax=Lipomyces kononenkoae TaxID=34357 RepID=A0ACC3T7E9_LIPKO